ncbi:MAG TPA: nucleotidyltransferase family protein [Candidatus Angelobacter sp.]|nr:nucleotidyltransferase family protein [Candidatus Angelobacter sp.]
MALSPSFVGVVLAAGASSRMGRDKALLPWQGGTFLSAAIRALQPETDFVLIVGGANSGDLEPIVNRDAAFLVVNPDPQQGQFSSLRIGVQEVLNRGRDAAIITLVDRPAADQATITRLKETFLAADQRVWAVVPEYNGKHGHPIVIGREMISAFLDAPATSTAREVEHLRQEHILYVPVDDPLVAANVDTPEDFARLSTGTPA